MKTYYMAQKSSFNEENKVILKLCASNKITSKFTKQILAEFEGEMDKYHIGERFQHTSLNSGQVEQAKSKVGKF